VRARIAHHLGNRAEATQIGLYFFHIGLARIGLHIDDKANFWKRHFDFFQQLRAATVGIWTNLFGGSKKNSEENSEK
jgi:hypothetical protein